MRFLLIDKRFESLGRTLAGGFLSLLLVDAAAQSPAFRVCADPNNLPLSSQRETGFENRIAQLWADELGLPLEYTWFPQRRGFVRNTLKSRDPLSGEFKCDVVIGVAAGFDQLQTTKPYYRSTYALVINRTGALADIAGIDDFLALPQEARSTLRIGAFTPTPGTRWLQRHGFLKQLVAYPAMSGLASEYPGEIIEKELASGKLDAAVVWGPIGGYFASHDENARLALFPLSSEPGLKFDFAISAGVRYRDDANRERVERLIAETGPEVKAILDEYRVPQLDLSDWVPPPDDDD